MTIHPALRSLLNAARQRVWPGLRFVLTIVVLGAATELLPAFALYDGNYGDVVPSMLYVLPTDDGFRMISGRDKTFAEHHDDALFGGWYLTQTAFSRGLVMPTLEKRRRVLDYGDTTAFGITETQLRSMCDEWHTDWYQAYYGPDASPPAIDIPYGETSCWIWWGSLVNGLIAWALLAGARGLWRHDWSRFP